MPRSSLTRSNHQSSIVVHRWPLPALIAAVAAAAAIAQTPLPNLGYTDTPLLPGLPYHVHDPARPRPAIVTPAARVGDAPSDATVLFDGTSLSAWTPAKNYWRVENGYMEVVPNSGDLRTTMIQLNGPQPERLYDTAEASYYVLGGEGTLWLDGKETKLQTNGFVSVPRGVTHSFVRRGNRPFVLLATLSGAPCEQPK